MGTPPIVYSDVLSCICVVMSRFDSGSHDSAAQPEPMIVIAQLVNCALNPANDPKSFVSCSPRSPDGSPPPLGVRFCQNSECITCPDRWNPSAFSSAPI